MILKQGFFFSIQKKQPKLICKHDYPKGVVVVDAVAAAEVAVKNKVVCLLEYIIINELRIPKV